ncbi:MAG: hypothetical protein PHS81_01510 [Candidatus Nanoarchaeia archaeon]|nr:hypothetical protein [Candidatus Nanoarchaeia archaeon]
MKQEMIYLGEYFADSKEEFGRYKTKNNEFIAWKTFLKTTYSIIIYL